MTARLSSPEELASIAAEAGLASPSIVIRELGASTSAAIALEPDAPLYPASMIKLPIALALTTLWATGEYRPETRVRVEAEDLTSNDLPSPFESGYRARLEELGRLMLTHSDNTATNVLIRILGRARMTSLCQAAGLTATAVRRKLSGGHPLIDDPAATGRNAHPAADSAQLLALVAHDAVPGAGWLLGALERQEWNGKLNGGLEPGDRFAHKTGDTDEVSHDGGILTLRGGARWVVVVYTALASPDEGDPRFAAFMRAL